MYPLALRNLVWGGVPPMIGAFLMGVGRFPCCLYRLATPLKYLSKLCVEVLVYASLVY
jgi:hypothetical protein